MSHFGVPHTVNHAASGALRRNGKAAMSRIDRSKSRSAGGKGFYIALVLCAAVIGVSAWSLLSGTNTRDSEHEQNAVLEVTPAPTIPAPETANPHRR